MNGEASKKQGKTIKANDVFKKWHEDPAYMEELRALDDEFELAQKSRIK